MVQQVIRVSLGSNFFYRKYSRVIFHLAYPQTSNIPNPFGVDDTYPKPTPSSASFNESFNPFDVTNDDAGFFATPKPKTIQQQKPAAQPAVDTTPPPNMNTQRLLRVASMLFERGLLIKADKIYIQELVLRGDKKAERALEQAELDGDVDKIQSVLLTERKKEEGVEGDDDDDEDNRAEAAVNSFKQRKSVIRKNSDEEDEQTEGAGDARRASWVPKDGVEAPHPLAGGYHGTIPASMGVQKGNFVGPILMRISSKKMFRKWKPVFFSIERSRLVIFENKMEYEMGTQPRTVIYLHECMWIAKPTLKKTYSLIDDGRRVYFSTLKENSQATISAAVSSGMEKPVAFSPALESRVVAKFASHYPDEISAFAYAVYSVILHHQREVRSNKPGLSRQTSGFGGKS